MSERRRSRSVKLAVDYLLKEGDLDEIIDYWQRNRVFDKFMTVKFDQGKNLVRFAVTSVTLGAQIIVRGRTTEVTASRFDPYGEVRMTFNRSGSSSYKATILSLQRAPGPVATTPPNLRVVS